MRIGLFEIRILRKCEKESDVEAFQRGIMLDIVRRALEMRDRPHDGCDRSFRVGVRVSDEKLMAMKKESKLIEAVKL